MCSAGLEIGLCVQSRPVLGSLFCSPQRVIGPVTMPIEGCRGSQGSQQAVNGELRLGSGVGTACQTTVHNEVPESMCLLQVAAFVRVAVQIFRVGVRL